MAFNNNITVVGNITRDPELRFTPGGAAVANFGLAWNRKDQNGEDVASFFDVTCWRSLAENVAESLTKGARVIVTAASSSAPGRTRRASAAPRSRSSPRRSDPACSGRPPR